MANQERMNEKTPNGGAYSVIYYLDDDGQPIESDKATRAEIVEFDVGDNAIWRTYGELEPQP